MGKKPANKIIEINSSLSLREQIQSVLQPQIDANKKLAPFLTEIYYTKYYPSIVQQVYQYATDNNITEYKNFGEIMYLVMHDMTQRPKCLCGNVITKYTNYFVGYNKYCSQKCASNDPDKIQRGIEKYKAIMMDKYGVDNISKLQSIKDKKAETMIKNFGVAYNSQRAEIKEILSNNIKSESHQEAIKAGITKSLGVSNPSLSQTSLDKRQATFDKKTAINLLNDCINNNLKLITNTGNDLELECNICSSIFSCTNTFFQNRLYANRTICTICNPLNNTVSLGESELIEFITNNYNGTILLQNRTIITPYELDIYLPELNIAFEFNGLYWHSELQKGDSKYHQNKSKMCTKHGIKLIHIWEDLWEFKNELTKNKILLELNKIKQIIPENYNIIQVSTEDTKSFIKQNNINGWIPSQINYGIYIDNNIISIISISINDNVCEINNFCELDIYKTFDILFNYIINDTSITNIIRYEKYDWYSNNIQNKFKLKKITEFGFSWIINKKRYNRFKINKQKLIDMELLLPGESETTCMHRLGYYRIYDCGSMLFEWDRTLKIE